MNLVVVCGPPCSGKSTYVKEHFVPGDLLCDLDLLWSAVSGEPDHSGNWGGRVDLLLDFREAFISRAQSYADGTAYIIACTISPALDALLPDDAEVVCMDASEAECLRRLDRDGTRVDKERWRELIAAWFRRETKGCGKNMKIAKSAIAVAQEVSAEDLALINKQALTELSPSDIYTFKVHACDDLVDRDLERFPLETLEKLAPMFVGRPVIADHAWSAKNQTARIYDAQVEHLDDRNVLTVKCYMLRSGATRDLIAAIDGGILREVSVGCAVGRSVCSVCGSDRGSCGHAKGETYNGRLCVTELRDPVDAYELSFVAVPAQPGAGITKTMKSGLTPAEIAAARAEIEIENEKWRY